MKNYFVISHISFKKTQYFLISSLLILLGISIVSIFYPNPFSYYLFHSSMADLKKWYPNFYFLIFVFFQTLKLFPIIILTAQLIIIFLSRNVRWFMKLFLLINTLLLQLYLPDFIWFSSFQILILWLYFNPENTLVKPLKKSLVLMKNAF